jgi:hypothetical protein
MESEIKKDYFNFVLLKSKNMIYVRSLLITVLCFSLIQCKTSADQKKLINPLVNTDSLKQIDERIRLDFSVSEDQVKEQLKERSGEYSDVDKSFWEENGWLEWRLIDEKKMYFNRAVSNLFLIKKFNEEKDKRLLEIAADPEMILRKKHTEEILKASQKTSDPVIPVQMKITYTITVIPDAVADGETIRCWLPFPKEGHPRQNSADLLSTSEKKYIISPEEAIHRTLYMETRAETGKPTTFMITFKYQSKGQYVNMKGKDLFPYNRFSEVYKKYTKEQLPHICFTPDIKRLADSITSQGDRPSETVRKIYLWFKENIPWTGALEYSIIPNIPEYVYLNRRGDCGMQTFMFMSMLRYKGIPVRWQSGWKVPPGDKNLHDWCEVYYEGVGWVPVDVSYDLQSSDIKELKEFYISGIDSYRMIVNDGIAGALFPPKKFMRSEPFDFQRGEVEWSGGNLYFDKWDYDMKIEYIK